VPDCREEYEDNFGHKLDSREALSVLDNEQALFEDRFKRRLDEIERQATPGRILDIGSHAGFFLASARARGWQPYGVDIEELSTGYARRKFGLEIFRGELAEAKFPDGYFKAVTCWHLLEHIPDPLLLLKEIRRILQKDGLLALETPNLAGRRFKKLNSDWDQIKPRAHLYYFTKDTLAKLLERAGFKVLSVKFYSDTAIAWELQRVKLNRIAAVITRFYRYLKWLKPPIVFLKTIWGNNDDKMVFLAK